MRSSPEVRRVKLGAELRRLRVLAGLTSAAAARLAGWHQSKVSRIETGRSGVKPSDVALLLHAYGVRDTAQRELLEALCGAGADESAGWWHSYRRLLPAQYRDFIRLESQACTAHTFETSVMPGLLQTPGYAKAVTRASLDGLPARTVDSLVDVRLARQRVLDADPPLELSAVVDEAALHRRIGGRGVMAEQLRHVQEVARLPHVRLQVMPFAAGGHLGLTGSFTIFSFSNIIDLDVVVLDHLMSSRYLERKEELKAYSAAFRRIQARALPQQQSLDLIAVIGDGV
ncbi:MULTISPECIES: helix-turn-helix domain-containing protein [unclassified Streptomyces]|uniref:helix-turn-helix domain-containing protein n=1 Tax=unclassified Streptomyces TaxID=2593676 RepID=UPI002E1BFB3C|nr:helix-turn-helix domain-containing protein [Streptomyces sp. NBC_01023]